MAGMIFFTGAESGCEFRQSSGSPLAAAPVAGGCAGGGTARGSTKFCGERGTTANG